MSYGKLITRFTTGGHDIFITRPAKSMHLEPFGLSVHAFCGTGDENIIPTCRSAGNYYIPYIMPCQPGHTMHHSMPRQAITYTMLCPPCHIIYLTMPARSYHIPCHGQRLLRHLSKGANGLGTRCMTAC